MLINKFTIPNRRRNNAFIPYKDFVSKIDPKILIKDTEKDTSSVFVSGCNDHYLFRMCKEYYDVWDEGNGKEERFAPDCWIFGVCDNATQALEYFKKLEENEKILKESPYVLYLMPVLKSDQPSWGGWRWHKWGEYIGIQNHKCEYLYDEEGTEMVFCFEIRKLKERK